MTLVENIFAPNLDRTPWIVPLGPGYSSGVEWRKYLALGRTYHYTMAILSGAVAVMTFILPIYGLFSNDHLITVNTFWGAVLLVSLAILGSKITLDTLRLTYFLCTSKYIHADTSGRKRLSLYK